MARKEIILVRARGLIENILLNRESARENGGEREEEREKMHTKTETWITLPGWLAACSKNFCDEN